MGMAMKLAGYLREHPVPFDCRTHRHSENSRQSATASQVPLASLAKAVVLEDERARMLMAVLPASRKLKLGELCSRTGHDWHLASEAQLGERFHDCESGAVPPIGSAYGMDTVLDESLLSEPELYFEAGDHETLVHVKTSDFVGLLPGASRMAFSEPKDEERSPPLF